LTYIPLLRAFQLLRFVINLRATLAGLSVVLDFITLVQVGMNALGHRMFHVHSDEDETWSAEIMSSGLSAGFTFTNREKGLQKGDGKEGSQWTIYSKDKSFRVKVNKENHVTVS